MRYSENYVFTAKATSADDLQKIKTLRQTVKAINHMQSQYEKDTGQEQTRYRVCLRGRLGKNNPKCLEVPSASEKLYRIWRPPLSDDSSRGCCIL